MVPRRGLGHSFLRLLMRLNNLYKFISHVSLGKKKSLLATCVPSSIKHQFVYLFLIFSSVFLNLFAGVLYIFRLLPLPLLNLLSLKTFI